MCKIFVLLKRLGFNMSEVAAYNGYFLEKVRGEIQNERQRTAGSYLY